MADFPQTTSDSGIPRFLRLLTTPALPELSDVAQQLRDSSLNNMRQAAGPEAAGRSFLQKALSGASSVGQTALAGAADVGAGLTPSDLLAGGLGAKVAGPYYAAKGAIGSLGSVQKATETPTPENVQRALTDLSMTFLGAHSGVKAHLGGEVPTEAPEAPTSASTPTSPAIPGLMTHAQNVADIVRDRGGATYSLREGDRTGQNQYSVAMMPERDRKVAGEVTPQSVAQFMQDNADVYANRPDANVGVWNAPDKNHYLEVSKSTHDLQNAMDVAKKYNQYAIYDLKNGRDIPTGGTGGVTDAPAPNEDIRNAANEYNAERGRPQISGSYLNVDPRAKDIADAYDAMQHTPNDAATAKSYNAFKQDISDQYHYAQDKMGMKFEPWTQEGQPYRNSKEMMQDVTNNHHLYFFTGGDFPADHPMSEADPTTGLTFNDEFRAVHDLFGHAQSGYEFGPRGEENAWATHKQMMSPDAVPAMTSETRGQNSYVNFGQHLRDADGNIPAKGEAGYIPPAQRPFAPQKAGLLPPELQGRGEVNRLDEVTTSPEKTFMTLRHYSETPVKDGILSGARRGIGANGSTIRNVGAEGTRVALGGAPQGVYFYKDGGQGEPQIVARPNESQTQGQYALADLKDNPIFSQAVQAAYQRIKENESSIPGLSAKQAPVSDAEAQARAINEGEKALQAAGYDGYTNTSGDTHNQNIVFLFGDHKVSKVVPDNVAPKRIISGPMLSNSQAGATVMPASIISKVLPKSSDERAQSLITKAGANYQGPWGFAESGQPEQYAFTDPATGNTLALGEKELNKNAVAEKLAQSRLSMLNDEEKGRIGPRQIKQFSDIMMSLPKLQEMEDIAKAGMVAKDWYPNARAAFHQLGNVAPDYFRPGDEIKFANVIGSTSPNQAVEMNLREGIGVWKRWVDAGRPTDVKSVTKLLDKIPDSDLTSAASKVPNLVSSLIGQDLFTGRKQYFKAPSFGQALGGNPTAKTPIDETFVGDTHVADMYGVKPTQVFKNAQLYYALAAHTRAVARKLNIPTDAAQASMWAATLAVKNAIGENPEATPSEIASMVTPERIAADSKDMADILLHDSVSRNLIKSMLPEGKTLDEFDEGLRQIVKGRPVDATGQGTIAAGGVTALAAKLKGKTNQATSVSYPKPLDTPLPERQLTGNYDDPIALAVNSGEMKDGKYVSTPNPLVTAEKQMYVKVESTFGPEVAQLLQDSVLDRTYNRHTAPADAGTDVTNAAGQQFIDEAKALIASDGRSGIPTPKPETYYHGTDSDNVNSILRQGILAKHTGDSQGDVSNRSWRYSSEDEPYNGSVFLTKAFDEAARFSHKGTVLELSVPHSLYRQFDSDDVGDELFNGDVPAQHIVARHDYNNGKWQQQEITPPNVSGTNKGLEALAARLKGNDKVKRGKMTFK